MNPPVNILLVDDDPRNLDVLESVLESPEYRLVRALTAEGALKLLLDGDFAAMVLDIRMPEMSGLELANLIKQRKRTRHIPIIFLTAYFQDDNDVIKGYDTGAVDYLTKPINPRILRSKIAVFADLYRMTRALAAMNRTLEVEIAHRHQAEEAMRSVNNELETRVRARTQDLLRVNAELRESEAQLRLVTDHAPVLLVQCDRRHCIKFVNRTFAERFGFEPDQSTGLHFSKVVGDEAYAAFKHSFDSTLEGRRVEIETEIQDAALGTRWLQVIHEPERSASGEVVGLVAVISDITERKLVEREVAMSRDKALAGSRAKDDFLARLSHELRTPLSPVLLLASDAAGDPALPESVRDVFGTIAKHVTLEARLIDDLLDLTSITHGKVALELRPFDVRVSLREALAMVRPEIAQKHIEVAIELKAEPHTVLGDDVRLKQIFWNVLKNAVKFTPDAGRITIETAVDRGERKSGGQNQRHRDRHDAGGDRPHFRTVFPGRSRERRRRIPVRRPRAWAGHLPDAGRTAFGLDSRRQRRAKSRLHFHNRAAVLSHWRKRGKSARRRRSRRTVGDPTRLARRRAGAPHSFG